MSSPMPNIDLNPGRKKATKVFKGSQKLNLPSSPAAAFPTFLQEGNIFNVRDKTKKIDRFIPRSPAGGLEGSFEADQFVPSSTKTGKRIGKLFKFEF